MASLADKAILSGAENRPPMLEKDMYDSWRSRMEIDIECIALSSNFKLIDESQVLLRVPKKNNMYSVDLKNTIPKGGTKASDNVGQAKKETEPIKDYILLPLWTADPPFPQDLKSSHDDGFKPSSDDGKTVDEDPSKETECNDQEKEDNVNSTNNVKTDGDDGEMAYKSNLETTIQVSPTPTRRFHKDHHLDQVIRDLHLATQTRQMSKNLGEHGFVSTIQQRTNHKDLQNCLFACFYHKKNPKKKMAISTKLVFGNKRDERGIMIRNEAKFVIQGHTREEGIDYDEIFSPVARIEAIRLFLAYVSFKDFMVYQMYVKSAFLYGKIEEEVYVCQPPGFEDPDFPDRVYKVEKALFGLHQAPRAWYETLSTHLLDNGGFQFLGCRLISWQCKKQTVVTNSTTEAEYWLLQVVVDKF
nr:putative ribonuclease H-like domain-containing protein [Tanacetum cinerariifolium]